MILFVYGTLRPSLYPHVCEQWGLKSAGPALTKGWTMYNLGRFPAVVEALTGSSIIGELVIVDNLDRLDRYEGYRPNGQGLYNRKTIEVFPARCTQEPIWLYYMNNAPQTGEFYGDNEPVLYPVIPSGDWEDVVTRSK